MTMSLPKSEWIHSPVTMQWYNVFTQELVNDEDLERGNVVSTTKIDLLMEQARKLQDEAERLANLPAEPDSESVLFKKRFNNTGIYYTYTAVRVANGTWYISGSRSAAQGVSWQHLIEWISAGSEWEVWEATEFMPLASNDGTFSYDSED